MNNKATKAAVIVASVLAVLLLTAFVIVVIRGGQLAGIFDLGGLFHRETTADFEESSGAPLPETSTAAEARASSEASSTEETGPALTPEQLKKTLNIGAESLKGRYVQLYASADGDKIVCSLTQVNLLTLDRSGNVLYRAGEQESSVYNGTEYAYQGIADIDVSYDEEADITTYTITLRKGLAFSDGVPLTTDDLIFNYYLRLQPEYEGIGNLRLYNIVGLQNYYYNSDEAENQSVSDEEVAAELADPGETVSAYILKLISDTLEEEARQCAKLWRTYQAYGYGNSAQEFFYNIYGLDLNYNLVDKDLDTVCRDVTASYGMDYRRLADNYAVNENYFDERINSFVRETLLYDKLQAAEGNPVDYISGIIRLGTGVMKLKTYGYDENAVYDLLDIDVLPMHYYGDPALYDYNAHCFGFVRGQFSIPEEKLASPLGAGPYVYVSGSLDSATFVRNSLYYRGEAGTEFINLRCDYGEGLGYVAEGAVDVVSVIGNKENYETICKLNSNNELAGDALVAHEVNVLGYAYIGINANNVNVGGEPDSEASKNLRRGLATALAAFRGIAYRDYFGDSIDPVEYPVSDFYGLAPKEGDPDYTVAFSRDAEGELIYTPDMDTSARFYAVVDAVREYFTLAGYSFDQSGKLLEAPDGGAVLFGVSICSDEYSFDVFPSYEVLTYAKSVLFAIGISLDIRYIPDADNMLIALYTGTCDLWCASWYTAADPGFAEHYQGFGRTNDMIPNIYGIADQELDAYLAELKKTDDRAEKVRLSRRIMDRVVNWAVEIPCYQLNNYYVFNANTLKTESIPKDLTAYHSWLDEIINLEVGNRE